MGRPSLLRVQAQHLEGGKHRVRLGGDSVIVAEGSISV